MSDKPNSRLPREGRDFGDASFRDIIDQCPRCGGTGVCQTCGGDGYVTTDFHQDNREDCPECHNDGHQLGEAKCPDCKGSGKAKEAGDD